MEMELDFSKIELEIMSSKVYLFGGGMVCGTDVVRNISIPGLRWILRFQLLPSFTSSLKVRSSPPLPRSAKYVRKTPRIFLPRAGGRDAG